MKCDLSFMAKYSDLSYLLLRLPLGVIFIMHGMMKWSIWSAPAATMSPTMVIIFKILSIAEPLGGLAIILGALTRWAGIGLSLVMVGAIYMKITAFSGSFIGKGSTGWEFDLILLAVALSLAITGAGKYALDEVLCKKKESGSAATI